MTPLEVSLLAVSNIKFGENSKTQVSLPIRLGGLGIRMAEDIGLLAFISSLYAVWKFGDGILNNILLSESNGISTKERESGSSGLVLAEGRNVGKQKSGSEPPAEPKVARL